jgi:hypothetical protein
MGYIKMKLKIHSHLHILDFFALSIGQTKHVFVGKPQNIAFVEPVATANIKRIIVTIQKE